MPKKKDEQHERQPQAEQGRDQRGSHEAGERDNRNQTTQIQPRDEEGEREREQ